MHYKVEVYSSEAGWLGTEKRYKLLTDAALRAAQAEGRGCATRIVRVASDGAREVVEAKLRGRGAAQVRPWMALGPR
jgi:hypothetical protein